MRNCFVKLLFVLISFVNTNRAIVFECDFNRNTGWVVIGNAYACHARILTGESTALLNVNGIHLEGNSNDNVKALTVIGHGDLTRIPQGIENFFPHLQLMDWNYGNLTAIDADDLKPFPSLLLLVMGSNKIVSLDSDLFKYTSKLEFIHFPFNSLEHVGRDLLTNLSNLTYADFQYNPCINFLAETSVEVEELKPRLLIQCPPLGSPSTTTDSLSTTTTFFMTTPVENNCPIECSSRIESVEQHISRKTDELSRQNNEQNEIISFQNEKISQLQNEVSDLNLAIDSYEMRIVELEKLIREISSSP